MAIRAVLLGVDISPFVTSWGRLEQIKDILLTQATFLTTEMTIQLSNINGFLNPKGAGSLVAGLDHYNGSIEIFKDEKSVYQGLVQDILPNTTTKTVSIVSENVLRKAAETDVNAQATAANPALAMLDFARLAIPESAILASTFEQAASGSAEAGATINYDFKEGDNITIMQAIQLVSDISSISVFVKDNKVIARPFIPFQGNEAGLKFEINDAIAREWGPLSYDNSSFNNRVSVGFPTDQFFTLTDEESVRRNGGDPRKFEFPADEKVVATNLTSAQFFARIYLRRAAKRRRKLTLAGGRELNGSVIGDRFPVTVPDLGLNRFPMEAIEVNQTLDSDEIELGLAEIFAD